MAWFKQTNLSEMEKAFEFLEGMEGLYTLSDVSHIFAYGFSNCALEKIWISVFANKSTHVVTAAMVYFSTINSSS